MVWSQGPIGNKHSWEKGGNDILVPNPLVLEATKPETPEGSDKWRTLRTHIPLVQLAGKEGSNGILPK